MDGPGEGVRRSPGGTPFPLGPEQRAKLLDGIPLHAQAAQTIGDVVPVGGHHPHRSLPLLPPGLAEHHGIRLLAGSATEHAKSLVLVGAVPWRGRAVVDERHGVPPTHSRVEEPQLSPGTCLATAWVLQRAAESPSGYIRSEA